MNSTLIINGSTYNSFWVVVLMVVLFIGGLAIGFLYYFLKTRKLDNVPDKIPPLKEIAPKYEDAQFHPSKIMHGLEIPANHDISNQGIDLSYEAQLESDITKIKKELNRIESEVETMRINYCTLKKKLKNLENVRKMLI